MPLLQADDLFVALEITPPKTPRREVLLRRARLLGDVATVINVIQRPGRQSSLDASRDLREAGFQPVWHLLARGDDAHALSRAIDRAREAGIEDVLCILGDRTGAPAMKVREMVTAVREGFPEATVGATINQYAASPAGMSNLFGKLEAGATFVETQPSFAIEHLAAVVEPAKQRFQDVGFVAMVMPVETLDAAARMESRLGFAIPESYRSRVAEGRESAWEAFAENLRSLRSSGLVAGVTVMTPEMDPAAETGARIREAVAAAGLAPAAAR